MWISRHKYERLLERVSDLEKATYCPCETPDTKVGRIVKMLLDHLGLHVERYMPYDKLAKKGGPERG